MDQGGLYLVMQPARYIIARSPGTNLNNLTYMKYLDVQVESSLLILTLDETFGMPRHPVEHLRLWRSQDLDLETALMQERPSDIPCPAVLTHFVNENFRRSVVFLSYQIRYHTRTHRLRGLDR